MPERLMTGENGLRWGIATKKFLSRKEIERDLDFYTSSAATAFTSKEAHLRLLRTALALYERVAAAQERIEELEAARTPSGPLGMPLPVSVGPTYIREARVSVALDKEEVPDGD